MALIAAMSVASTLRGRLLIVRVSGRSMFPALEDGDRLLTTRAQRTPLSDVRAGDIVLASVGPSSSREWVAVDTQWTEDELMIKRVGVVGPAKYSFNADHSHVHAIECHGWTVERGARGEPDHVYCYVPRRHVFLTSDNPTDSVDSRYFGSIGVEHIHAVHRTRTFTAKLGHLVLGPPAYRRHAQ